MSQYVKALRFLERFKIFQENRLILSRQSGKVSIAMAIMKQFENSKIIVKTYRLDKYKKKNKKVRIWEK